MPTRPHGIPHRVRRRLSRTLALASLSAFLLAGTCSPWSEENAARVHSGADSGASAVDGAGARALSDAFDATSQRLARAVDRVDPLALRSMLSDLTVANDKLAALQTLNHQLDALLAQAKGAEAFDYRIVFYTSDVQSGWRAILDPGTPHEKVIFHGTAPFRGMGAAKILTEEASLPNHRLTPGRHELVFELLPRPNGYFAADVEVLGANAAGQEYSLYRWRIVGQDDLADLERVGPAKRPWYRLQPFVFQVRVAPRLAHAAP